MAASPITKYIIVTRDEHPATAKRGPITITSFFVERWDIVGMAFNRMTGKQDEARRFSTKRLAQAARAKYGLDRATVESITVARPGASA